MQPAPGGDPLAAYLAAARLRALGQLPAAQAEEAVAAHRRDLLARVAAMRAADPKISYEEALVKSIFSMPADPIFGAPPVAPLPVLPLPVPPPPPALPPFSPIPHPPVGGGWLGQLLHVLGFQVLGVKGKAVLVAVVAVAGAGTAYTVVDTVPPLLEDGDLLDGATIDGTPPVPSNTTGLKSGEPRVLYVRDHRETVTVGEQAERFFVPPELGGFSLFVEVGPEGGCVTVTLADPEGNTTSTTQACPGPVTKSASFVGNGTWTVRYTFLAFSGKLAVSAAYDEAAELAVRAADARGGREGPRA